MPGLINPEQVEIRTVISSPARAAASIKSDSVSNWSNENALVTRSALETPTSEFATSVVFDKSPTKISTPGRPLNLSMRGSSSLRLQMRERQAVQQHDDNGKSYRTYTKALTLTLAIERASMADAAVLAVALATSTSCDIFLL